MRWPRRFDYRRLESVVKQNSAIGEAQRLARTHAIFTAHRKDQTLQQIADTHGISRERVRQILLSGRRGKTLSVLPGTETLSALTRGLLIRLGYRRAAAVQLALKEGTLYDGCTFGMGTKRFSEIEAWARKRDSLPALAGASRPANPQRRVTDRRRHPGGQGDGGVERRVLAYRRNSLATGNESL